MSEYKHIKEIEKYINSRLIDLKLCQINKNQFFKSQINV